MTPGQARRWSLGVIAFGVLVPLGSVVAIVTVTVVATGLRRIWQRRIDSDRSLMGSPRVPPIIAGAAGGFFIALGALGLARARALRAGGPILE